MKYLEKYFLDTVEALQLLCEDVPSLEDSHISCKLPKSFLGVSKVNYLLRVTPTTCMVLGAPRFDDIMQAVLRSIMDGAIDAKIYWELQMPITIKPGTNPHLCLGLHLLFL